MNWYYLENGTQRGPITEAEFPALFQVGALTAGTYLWCEGMSEWKPYNELLGDPKAAITPEPAPGGQAPASPAAGGLRVRQEEAQAERMIGCSQCGATTPASQIMRVGSSALCPKCQEGYRRQAHFGFGEQPAEYANVLVRLGAFILDYVVCLGVALGLVLGARFVGRQFFADNPTALTGIGTGSVICVIIWMLDYFIGRIAREGATPAMKMLKIKVVTASGGSVGGWRALGRWLMIGLTNSFTFGLGHLLAVFDKQHRSVQDVVCGTVVIKR